MIRFYLLITLLLTLSPTAYGMNLMGRLGIGFTNQVVSGIDAISFKLQRSRSTALGALVGVSSGEDASNYAVGGKFYKLIYDEPQLNFYSAFSAIMFTYQDEEDETDSGHQVEAAFGAEFSFQGLESLGFSFEFGAGMHKYNGETTIETIGYNMLVSAVHFYL